MSNALTSNAGDFSLTRGTAQEQRTIRLAAIDLDGTLLSPQGKLTARNAEAIRRACEAGVSVVLATGKSRASATWIIDELDMHMPGVFTQGTTVYDAEGAIWHSTTMAKEAAASVLRFAEARSFPYLVYAGQRLLMAEDAPFRRQMHEQYDEPLPEIVGSLLPQIATISINKIVVYDPVDEGTARQALQALCEDRAHVTQAVRHFVEVLPAGASKGAGLRWLLGQMGITPSEALAIGDGENDIEMLQTVGVGVAMGNAHPRVKAVADLVVGSHEESGVAEALARFVLG
jgi:Cof subfamily protein (haloacid dehalogenase superfamily)